MQFVRFRSLVSSLAVFGLVFVFSAQSRPCAASPGPEKPHLYGQHPSASANRHVGAAEKPHAESGDDTPAEDAAENGDQQKSEKDEKEDKWSVDEAPGPKREIPIQVEEGTWMSLDISPDGSTIVFDLLGDLYEMPIEGGRARSITAGVSWDMQPRYSPDGTKIAFTSDRGGGDNLWVMKRLDRESAVVSGSTSSVASGPVPDGSGTSSPEGEEDKAEPEDPNSVPGIYTGWGKPTPVSSESYRLVNSPTWTPDSQFIAGHKHFTSRRSLGAGEIWLYHWTGGDGLQMIEKPNDQKDLGEPVFSPDGRYLYYSQDTTPGSTFQYNKDSNGQIYTIERLDREDGRVDRLIGGPGGAIRPTPSPDGKLMAFMRRVRFQTVLFLHDLESGEEWPIYDAMERDMQETWAIHGVYPTIAWTPDSSSIVFWAGGKIQKIAARGASAGLATQIDFTVDDTRTIYDHVLSPQTAWEETFDVKMLRWVQVSPDGSRVLFQALGYLWVRDLPDGEPRRLTDQTDHFEFYPAWSPDGERIVYTTWNDRELGSVRMIAVEGGPGSNSSNESHVITEQPGHYVEPQSSPDGNVIVFRKIEGGGLTSPTWSKDPGIYAATFGETWLVTRNGAEPFFGPADSATANTRIYFRARGDEDKRLLKSIDLDGSDERTDLESEAATEFRVSPDGHWIAFRERFNVFIAPFPPTGKTVSIGPKSKALPLAKVNADAGEYLHWSGDSQKLHWALGPELFTRELKDAFEFLAEPHGAGTSEGAFESESEGISEDAAEVGNEVAESDEADDAKKPPAIGSGVHIGFSQASDVPEGTIAFTGARVVTMASDPSASSSAQAASTSSGTGIIENGTVVVRGNRIVAVGGAGTAIPAGAKVIDAAGKTIIPGIVDIHYHGAAGADQIIPQQNWYHFAGLAFGVTTTHDPSNDTAEVFATSEMAQAGVLVAPRVFSTGTILYGASGSFKAEIDSLEDAQYHLKRLQAVGAFSVKSYNQPRRDQRQQVLTAARELGMLVYPEGGSTFMHNLTQIVDGHTTIEHSIPVANIYDDVKQLWQEAKVGYTPTLVVGYGGLWGEEYWYAKTNVWENERLMTFVPREAVDPRARRRTLAPDNEWNHFNNARICKELSDLGVDIQIGAHGQREGLGSHWEIWMLVQGGMTPHQALYSATLEGAREIGMDSDLGSLEPGKLADLVVIDGNPLEDIRVSEKVTYTMVNGRLYDAATMNEVGNRERRREEFWWEVAARKWHVAHRQLRGQQTSRSVRSSVKVSLR